MGNSQSSNALGKIALTLP